MIQKLTGYNQLKKNKKLDSYSCSSQACASGTCDSCIARKRELKRKKALQKIQLNKMVFERAS